MYKYFSLVLIFLILPLLASSQTLVKNEKINSYAQLELLALGLPAKNGIDLYKVWYNTLGADGTPDVASGLIVIPVIDEAAAMVCYQHGTSSTRNQIPSNEEGHFGELFLGSSGYIVSSADYIGMGESRGFHPYLHAETEASAAIDLLKAVKEFCEQQNIPFTDQLFVTGYSQGGHAAMAAFRALERDFSEEFPVTAAAPMSGPYNVSGSLFNSLLSEEEYLFPGYLTYIAKGYQEVYGNIYEKLSDIFKPQYAEIMDKFDNQEDYPLGQLHDELIAKMREENGTATPIFMFQNVVVEAVKTNDTNSPVVRAINDNNLYDWVPKAPTRMYYCEADEQVSFKNAIFTDSIMNANGAASVVSLSMGADLGHGGCAIPAFLDALTFFDSFKTTNTEKISVDNDLLVFPNPTTDILYWTSSATVQNVQIRDELGRIILQNTNTNLPQLDISNLAKGFYFLQLKTDSGIIVRKFIKN